MLPEPSSQATHAARNYIVTYLLLMLLLGLTWGAAYLPLGPFNIVVSLSIACAKALLVVLVFMHVRKSPRLVWFFAAAGILWLMILFGLTLSDYFSRGWSPYVSR